MIDIQPYKPRPIRFLELWQQQEWRIKIYGIAYQRSSPRVDTIEAAKSVASTWLLGTASTTSHYSVGFLGVHQGRASNFVFIDWWANENELHHHVFISPTDDPTRLSYKTPSGLFACTWDLRLIGFERQAWIDKVLQNSKGPDLKAYLKQRLNEIV